MSIRKTMYVKENSFRKLDDPFNDVAKKYVFYVKICDVPEGIPMATNPRDQKLTSGVAQVIKESLESNDGFFHLKIGESFFLQKVVHIIIRQKKLQLISQMICFMVILTAVIHIRLYVIIVTQVLISMCSLK